jgi:hypothetical protein
MRWIDVAFIVATCVVVGVVLFGVYRFHFKMRALSRRMAQYTVWNEEQSRKLAAGQLTETDRQELIHYGMRCIKSQGRWNYRGPWEKLTLSKPVE